VLRKALSFARYLLWDPRNIEYTEIKVIKSGKGKARITVLGTRFSAVNDLELDI